MTQAVELLPRLSCTIDIVAADGHATQGARSSSAMVLTSFVQTIPVLITERLTYSGHVNIYASTNWVAYGSGNGLWSVRHQTISWTNAELKLSIWHLWTKYSEI